MSKLKIVGLTLGGLALFLALFVGIWGFNYGFRWFTAEPRGALEQREITTHGAFRIQEYERFYRLQADILAIDMRLASLPADLNTRQQTDCLGILAVRTNKVAEYNAASHAELTKGKWKADDLPESLKQENPRKC